MRLLEIFSLLVPDELLEVIVEETNLFAQQFLDKENVPPSSSVHEWGRNRLHIAEIKKFLATIIAMGLVNLLKVEDHWSTSWPYAPNNFSSIFTRNRFSLIMRFLHLNDSSQYIPKGQPGHDPLYKNKTIYGATATKFSKVIQSSSGDCC